MLRLALVALVLLSAAACSKPELAGAGAPKSEAPAPTAGTAREIAAGTEHTCARLASGRVACWGSNAHGQLGRVADDRCANEDLLHGTGAQAYPCSAKPALVPGLSEVTRIAAGGDATCARTSAGAVMCWGQNEGGLVGDGTTTSRAAPTAVTLPAAAADVVMSDTHACALLVDGTVACWGVGFDGELGFAVTPTSDVSSHGERAVIATTAARVAGAQGATRVAVGSRATCIQTKDGDVSCFGLVGLGDTGAALRIARTSLPELAGARELFLGSGTHCATLAGGTSCWGASSEGPLAKPNDKGFRWSKLVPSTRVDRPRALAIVYGRACAADTKGDVTCWGYDGRGASAPRKIEGLTKVMGLGVGASHVCALDERGAVSCWGGSASGQTGRVEGLHVAPLFGEPRPLPLP